VSGGPFRIGVGIGDALMPAERTDICHLFSLSPTNSKSTTCEVKGAIPGMPDAWVKPMVAHLTE